jgi:hypothetical protein
MAKIGEKFTFATLSPRPAAAGQARRLRPCRISRCPSSMDPSGVIAGLSFIRWLTPPPRPRSGRLDGKVLRIMEATGDELWRKTFPQGFGPDLYYDKESGTRLWFGDLGHLHRNFTVMPIGLPPPGPVRNRPRREKAGNTALSVEVPSACVVAS